MGLEGCLLKKTASSSGGHMREQADQARRDVSLDTFKGLLVFGMMYCHVLQFFGNSAMPAVRTITTFVNLITFPGLMFSFGYVCQLAYFRKDLKDVYDRMLITGLKPLIAFYISGSCFRVIVDRRSFNWETLSKILILEDIPGWSEFFVSFSLVILVALALFKPLKKLIEKRRVFWLITPSLFFTTLIPYEKVTINQVGLLVGSTRFPTFPVLQHMPFYLLGMYFSRYEKVLDPKLFLGSIIATATSISYSIVYKRMPGRFPPSIMWILSPMLFLYVYYLVSKLLADKEIRTGAIQLLGKNVLLYTLVSNIFIFIFERVQGHVFLGPIGCLGITFLVALVVSYLICIARKL